MRVLENLRYDHQSSGSLDRGPRAQQVEAALAFLHALFGLSHPDHHDVDRRLFYWVMKGVRSAVIDQSHMMVGEEGAKVLQSILQNAPNRASSFFVGFAGLVIDVRGVLRASSSNSRILSIRSGRQRPTSAGGIWSFIRARLLSLANCSRHDADCYGFHRIQRGRAGDRRFRWQVHPRTRPFLLEGLNFLFLFVMSTVLFATIYKVLPSSRIEWKDVWMGAGITSVLFTIGENADQSLPALLRDCLRIRGSGGPSLCCSSGCITQLRSSCSGLSLQSSTRVTSVRCPRD